MALGAFRKKQIAATGLTSKAPPLIETVMQHRVNFLSANRYNFSAFLLTLGALVFSLVEAFDNTLFTNWFRQNIHLFTPLLPLCLMIIGAIKKESLVACLVNMLLLAGHYYFIWSLFSIGRSGADVIKLL